eukprot:IDg21944t1
MGAQGCGAQGCGAQGCGAAVCDCAYGKFWQRLCSTAISTRIKGQGGHTHRSHNSSTVAGTPGTPEAGDFREEQQRAWQCSV